ncbi:hypothetical protein NCC49_006431 [Naganishia albida]|nr:hypothetical protein NCC49_006431 [Naganishia albida]
MAPTEYNRGRGGSRGVRGGSGAGRGRGGFKVGPAHAPSNAYLGKAKKIKEDLINRARIKKSYAKTLKKEGLSSERLGSAGNATALGVRAKPYGTVFEEGDVLEINDASSGDDESDDDEGDDFEEDEELAAARRKMKGKDRDEGQAIEEAEVAENSRGHGKVRRREKPVRTRDSGYAITRDSGYANTRPARDMSTSKHQQHRPTPQNRTETRPDRPTTEGPSLRELKRQAYLGPPVEAQRIATHPSRIRKVQSKPAQAEDVGKTGGQRKPTATVEGKVQFGGRAPAGGLAGAGARRRDGRPNLNARMGVLLEQIQRTK